MNNPILSNQETFHQLIIEGVGMVTKSKKGRVITLFGESTSTKDMNILMN